MLSLKPYSHDIEIWSDKVVIEVHGHKFSYAISEDTNEKEIKNMIGTIEPKYLPENDCLVYGDIKFIRHFEGSHYGCSSPSGSQLSTEIVGLICDIWWLNYTLMLTRKELYEIKNLKK